jgi:hypothetical protein
MRADASRNVATLLESDTGAGLNGTFPFTRIHEEAEMVNNIQMAAGMPMPRVMSGSPRVFRGH